MSTTDLELTAHSIVANGRGILAATHHLSLINQQPEPKPWTLTFAYCRALQDEALTAWGGRDANVAAQRAFYNRACCTVAAAHGRYTTAMEAGAAAA